TDTPGFEDGKQDEYKDDSPAAVDDGVTFPPSGGEPQRKVYVDGVSVRVVAERVEYLDANGKLVTESLRDFTKSALLKHFASLDD
ncbi:restriction endonuclease, partial [Pseudomonas sp. BGM005]|nr:restriction endonuclease [Pseudomonas sp. BG5]